MPETENKMLDFPRGFRSLISSTIGYGAYTIIITWGGEIAPIGNYLASEYRHADWR